MFLFAQPRKKVIANFQLTQMVPFPDKRHKFVNVAYINIAVYCCGVCE